MSTPHPPNNISIHPLNLDQDLASVHNLWTISFLNYPLTESHLEKLISHKNGHHLLASIAGEPVGFCLAYTKTTAAAKKNEDEDQNNQYDGDKPIITTTGYIAVLAVNPSYRNKGVGITLLNNIKTWFRKEFGRCRIEVGSGIPRFWPGIPVPIAGSAETSPETEAECRVEGTAALQFFINRGFHIRPDPPRAVDLYRNIQSFRLDERGEGVVYGQRAKDAGYTFSPLTEDGYEECLREQERNFGHNADWVNAYRTLHPTRHPQSVMTTYDSTGKQAAWTLMLPPASPLVEKVWAMPAVCGTSTGLIGCVGVDKEHRGSGVGIALVAEAMESLRSRGVQGVFVDWVAIEGFYESLGFGVWGRYRVGEIIV
ncbi:hypothetical protein BDV06DRAFT_211368 [Aspergillus oleicola]